MTVLRIKIYILMFILMLCVAIPPVMSQMNNYRPPATSEADDERENINVYKTASAAVVTIKSMGGSGAGCLIDPSGIVITNKHVLGSSHIVKVSLADGNIYNASLIDVDNDDLALLKINVNRSFPYVRLGDSSRVEVGQRVLAIGNPFGLERTLTTGIVSRIDYNLNRIQTDAAINPGNSGGPLLNARGELIGINQAILNPSGRSSAGIGFAIPSNTVKRLLALSKNAKIVTSPRSLQQPAPYNTYKNLPSTAYQTKVFLGIAGKSLSDGRVVILGVAPNSPADKAGLRFRDVVLAVDSIKVQKFDDIGFVLQSKNPGDKINLLYMRNGIVNSSPVTLMPRN